MGFIFCIAVLMILAGPFSTEGQSAAPPAPPPLIRLTGTLLEPEKATARQVFPSLEVRIAGMSWTFHVSDVRSVTTDDPPGWPLLRDVRSFLIMTGPSDLVSRLQRAATNGQSVRVEGRLYTAEQILVLTDVQFVE